MSGRSMTSTFFPTLFIKLSQREGGAYTVELAFDQQASRQGKARFDFDALRLVYQPDLYGQTLTASLLADPPVRGYFDQAWAAAHGELRLVVEIQPEVSELHDLRWETLCHPESGDSLTCDTNRPFSRLLESTDWTQVKLRPRGQLKALVFVANPKELSRPGGLKLNGYHLAPVDVLGELRRARQGLQNIPVVDILASPIEAPGQATLESLTEQINQGYDILYLVCHGALLPEDPYAEQSPLRPFLIMEKSDGSYDRREGAGLVKRVLQLDAGRRPRLVVLASCQSGGQGKVPDAGSEEEERSYDRGALNALGPQLAQAGVPAVVAQQDNVKAATIELFSPAFFAELVRSGQVDKAIAVGRSAIQDQPDWWVPVLYSRLKDGCLFLEESAEPWIGPPLRPPRPLTVEPPPAIFVGRVANIDATIELLRLDAPPEDTKDVVAIHGMPGVGKTALMNALAYHPKITAAFPDGVLRADLGPEPDVMTTQYVWGREFGEDLTDYPTPESRKMRLLSLFYDKKALLLLDNVWQTKAAQYLLIGGPACRTLVATRNLEVAITLAGRLIYPLPPLDHEASLELLRNLTPDAFTVEPTAMEDLASRLAGLPLALNIVGQTIELDWRTSGDISRVLQDLQDREAYLRLSTPDEEPADGGEKHSLRAALQVSYERLPDQARKLAFRLLGVFDYQPASFDLPAASALWQLNLSEARKTISILTSRALLDRMASGRFTLQAVLADFATSLLIKSETDIYQNAKHRHAIYYLGIARHYRKEDYDRWHELDKDWDNLRAIANRVSNYVLDNKGDRTDLRLAADYAISLECVAQNRKIQDAKKWLQAGIEACRQLDRVESQAWLNLTLGSISLDLGKLDEATDQFQKSANLFTVISNPKGLSYAHGNLGIVERIRGDYDKALVAYSQVLEICLDNDDHKGAAYAYYNLGDVLRILKDRPTGRENLEKCVETCRQEPRMESLLILALSLLAELNLKDGSVEIASIQAEEGQNLAESTSSDHLLGIAIRAQAGIRAALEDHPASRAQFLESLRLLEQAGVHEELAETHETFASYLDSIDDIKGSLEHYQAAIQIFDEIGAHARSEEILQRTGISRPVLSNGDDANDKTKHERMD